LNLRREQLLDRLWRRQRAAVHALQNHIEPFQGAGHAEVREHLSQPVAS
jgi:hypothetical protein